MMTSARTILNSCGGCASTRRAASTAASAGVGLDELGAALATLTRAGVQTENAVTAVNQIILSFLKPSAEATKYARELGMTAFNDFFTGLLAGLKPTAGYTTDGRRWLKDAEPCLRELELRPGCLQRER